MSRIDHHDRAYRGAGTGCFLGGGKITVPSAGGLDHGPLGGGITASAACCCSAATA